MSLNYGRGVLVRVIGADSSEQRFVGRSSHASSDGTARLSCSGIVWSSSDDDGSCLILTSASIFAPFLEEGPDPASFEVQAEIGVMFEATSTYSAAELYALLPSESARAAFAQLTGSHAWEVGAKAVESSHEPLARRNWRRHCDIAVLRVKACPLRDLPPLSLRAVNTLARGEPLLIVASPFGLISPASFLNYASFATVGNFVGADRALIVTFASALAGVEGGPVFDGEGRLVGMMAPPIRRSGGVHVDLILSADGLATALRALPQQPSPPPLLSPASSTVRLLAAVERARKAVVLVWAQSNWGSGLLISPHGRADIVTCAHVVRGLIREVRRGKPTLYSGSVIKVQLERAEGQREWLHAELLHVAATVDVALLRIIQDPATGPPRTFPTLSCRENSSPLPHRGKPVFAVGFAVFPPSTDLQATVTSGVLSRVIEVKGRVVCLHSSAEIHGGSSGGALIDRDGYLLGMITGNMREKTGKVLPRLNFVMPVQHLQPFFSYCLDSPDPKLLSQLEESDPEVQAIWRVQQQMDPPKPHASKFFSFVDQNQDTAMRSKL